VSDRRRHRWRSGRLISTPINDGWALTLYERDPQVPNLPLEPQPPTEISGTASLAFGADLWTDGPKVVIPAEPRRIAIRGVYRTAEYRTGSRFAFWQPLEVAAPSGDIAGTAALTFGTGTVTLTGTGELTASAALTFGDTATLAGAGALLGASALAFGDAATLTGTGALEGSAGLVFGASASAELGGIQGASALVFGQTATLTGSGLLAGASALTFGQTATLTGAGALQGATALVLGQTADLTGTGALAGTTALLFGASMTPPTVVEIDGAAALAFDVTGTLTDASAPPAQPEQPSGGYGAQNEYNAARQRRKRRRGDDESKTPDVLPIEAQAGPGSSVATPTAPAADLELVRQLVAYWSGEGDREQLNRRAQRALDYALRAQSVLAMQLFERELARQMEDDEMSALLMLLAEDD